MNDTNQRDGAVRAWQAVAVALPLLALCAGVWLAFHYAAGLSPVGIVALPLIAGVPAMAALLVLAMVLSRQAGAARTALRLETERRQAAEAALLQAQKMAAIGQLADGIAHDFNNHLTAISSNVELLKRRLPDGAPALERLADSAIQGVRRAAALSQRLLAFRRERTPDPEPLDAGRVVAGMLDLLRRALGEKIELDAIAPSGLWLTRADSHQLESALLALAANARDAMPSGGRLTIETANAAPREFATAGHLAPGPYVTIAVHATEARPGFLTADPAGAFGLATVHDFARQSGGFLRIEAPASQGMTARLYLPRYVMPEAPVGTIQDGRTPDEPATVLVVEDEETLRAAAADALRELGYDVLEAPDAMEAVRLLADRGGIDLLFTDLGLPGGVNGRALADAACNINPRLKVLFTTGYARNPLLHESLSGIQEHFLPKPFSLEQLEAKVRTALGPRLGKNAMDDTAATAA